MCGHAQEKGKACVALCCDRTNVRPIDRGSACRLLLFNVSRCSFVKAPMPSGSVESRLWETCCKVCPLPG